MRLKVHPRVVLATTDHHHGLGAVSIRDFVTNLMLPWARRTLLRPDLGALRSPLRVTLGLSQHQRRLYSAKSEESHLSEYDYTKAREWYRDFNADQALRDVGEVTYSRSSGPGGQNVNKVNSKAQLRVPVERIFPLIPTVLHRGIIASRYYADKSSSLVIQTDDSRKAQANKDACFRKLTELILDVYKHTVPGETTEEQKEKVKGFQKAENESRLKHKKFHSQKKQSRSKGNAE